jgi:hypothetical protein
LAHPRTQRMCSHERKDGFPIVESMFFPDVHEDLKFWRPPVARERTLASGSSRPTGVLPLGMALVFVAGIEKRVDVSLGFEVVLP